MVDDPEMIHAKLLGEHQRLNAQLHDLKQVSADLFRDAIEEIHALRRQVWLLQAYKNHTERMLTMFEGGPRGEGGGHSIESEDVAWRLEQMVRKYVDPVEPGSSG